MHGLFNMPSESAIDNLLAHHRSASEPIHNEGANRAYLADFDPDKFRLPVRNSQRTVTGRLTLLNKFLLIKKEYIVVGRDSIAGKVDFHAGECVKIARQHFKVKEKLVQSKFSTLGGVSVQVGGRCLPARTIVSTTY